MRRAPFLALVASAAPLLMSCSSLDKPVPPGETAGVIYVGKPRISGRERLINDRREQEEWLHGQLQHVDEQTFGIGGAIDTRSLAVVAARLQLNAGPAQDVLRAQGAAAADLARQQGATALASEQIRTEYVQQIKSKLSKGEIEPKAAWDALSNVGAVPAQVPTPAASATEQPKLGSQTAADIIQGKASMPGTTDNAKVASLNSSPIELFRDKLALREEIRSELNENGLDESHDLYGHTLYRMTFDASLRPENDTSAWAVIEVSLTPGKDPEDLYTDYLLHLTGRLQERMMDRARKLLDAMDNEGCKTAAEGAGRILCGARSAFHQKLADAIVSVARDIPESGKPQRQLDIKSGLRLYRQWSRSVPDDANQKLDDVEVRVFRSLARVALLEFYEDRLNCYFDLIPAAFPAGTSDTSARNIFTSGDLLTNYLPRVSAPNTSDPDGREKRKYCGYEKEPGDTEAFKEKFVQALKKFDTPKVYAVTPKETVQRLSELSSRRQASEFIAGLQSLAGVGAIDAMLQSVKINDSFLQALRRQPLVVGFSDASEQSQRNAAFGWLLGPAFAVDSTGKPSFRHVVRQQALTATVSVPAWWREARLSIKSSWHRESSTLPPFASDKDVFKQNYWVALPFKLASLNGLFAPDSTVRVPEVENRYFTTVQANAPARLLIRGENLWRSSEVYLGAQPADRVRLLPDMQGLLAEFDRVTAPYGAFTPKASTVSVSVATSDGFTRIGEASIEAADSFMARTAVGVGRRFVGEAFTLTVQPPLRGPRTVELYARSSASGALNLKLADLAGETIALSRDGTELRLTPQVTALKLNSGDPIDLQLNVVSDTAVAPEIISVASDATYYKTTSDAQASLAWTSKGPGLRPVKLTLPPGARKGFASLSSGTANLRATLVTAAGVSATLDTGPCTVSKAPCVIPLKLPMPVQPEVLTAIKDGSYSVRFELTGTDAPTLSTEELSGS